MLEIGILQCVMFIDSVMHICEECIYADIMDDKVGHFICHINM